LFLVKFKKERKKRKKEEKEEKERKKRKKRKKEEKERKKERKSELRHSSSVVGEELLAGVEKRSAEVLQRHIDRRDLQRCCRATGTCATCCFGC